MFEKVIVCLFSVLFVIITIWFALTMLFFGCEYHFKISELDLEVIELRSNLAKKEIYAFKKMTGYSDTADYVIFSCINNTLDLYFDGSNLSTIYFDTHEPSQSTLWRNNIFNFKFGRLHSDEVMSGLLQEPKYLGIKKEVSALYFYYSFGLHCVYSHCVEDSVAIQKINSKHYDMKEVPTETTYEHRFVDDMITPSYQKRRYFLSEKKMKTILGI